MKNVSQTDQIILVSNIRTTNVVIGTEMLSSKPFNLSTTVAIIPEIKPGIDNKKYPIMVENISIPTLPQKPLILLW